MGYIFWGYFCLLFYLNFTFWNRVISLPPDFLGYLLIFAGLRQMTAESHSFKNARPFAIILAVLSFLDFICMIPIDTSLIFVFIGIQELLFLLMEGKILQGICEMETKHHFLPRGKTLQKLWVGEVILYVCKGIFFVMKMKIRTVTVVIFVALLVVRAAIFISLYQVKKDYGKWFVTQEKEE